MERVKLRRRPLKVCPCFILLWSHPIFCKCGFAQQSRFSDKQCGLIKNYEQSAPRTLKRNRLENFHVPRFVNHGFNCKHSFSFSKANWKDVINNLWENFITKQN